MSGPDLSQLGFVVQVPFLNAQTTWPGQNMIYSDPRDRARPWLVTLCAWQYNGLVTSEGSVPAANGIDTSGSYVATVEWGSGSARETCTVDWLYNGCSFLVHGSNIVVGAKARAPQNVGLPVLPRFAAFMVPSQVRAAVRPPTLTSLLTSVPNPGSVQIPSPPRAVGYRVIYPSPLALNSLSVTQQTTLNGVSVEFDASLPTNTETVASPEGQTSNRGQFYTLHPNSNRVTLTNNSGGAVSVYIQWQLDMG